MAKVVPIHVLKEYMGHSKIQTTQEFYLPAEAADADKVWQVMESLFDTSASHARNTRAMEQPEEKSEESKNTASPGDSEACRSEADGTRTRNHRIDSQPGESRNLREIADLRDISPVPAAPTAAPGTEPPLPPGLAAVVAAWPALPPAVRAGIVAMVQASASGH